MEIAKKNTQTDNDAVKCLLQKEYLNYYDCLNILKSLELDEGPTAKNMFGQYNSTMLRNWYTVIKAYEKDNLYFGEAARYLTQWVAYECPAMKKVIMSSEKQVSDLVKR